MSDRASQIAVAVAGMPIRCSIFSFISCALLQPPGRAAGGIHHFDIEAGELGADRVGPGEVLGGARCEAFGE